ncbi:MAG: hypothetical protein AAGJ53_08550, partial [Pseudomonadota bacterium]
LREISIREALLLPLSAMSWTIATSPVPAVTGAVAPATIRAAIAETTPRPLIKLQLRPLPDGWTLAKAACDRARMAVLKHLRNRRQRARVAGAQALIIRLQILGRLRVIARVGLRETV